MRALAARALDLRPAASGPCARRAARARPRSSARSRTGARTARRTRARTCARPAARGGPSSTSIPSAAASVASPRRRCSGANRRASCTVQITGGAGHSSAARANAWRSTRTSKRRVVGHQHPPAQHRRQLGQHVLGRGRRVDHRLRDPREALDAAPERVRHADERVELVVQLAAADQHRADLGQLAAIAGEPVGLGVEREELGRCERLFEHGPRSMSRGSDGATALARARCSTVRGRAPARPARPPDRRPRGLRRRRTRENRLRPPVPVTLTAAIHEDALQVSPATVGAGTVVLVVSNQSDGAADGDVRDRRARRQARRQHAPRARRSPPARPAALTIITREGMYSVHTADDAIRAARVKIGPPRESGQDRAAAPLAAPSSTGRSVASQRLALADDARARTSAPIRSSPSSRWRSSTPRTGTPSTATTGPRRAGPPARRASRRSPRRPRRRCRARRAPRSAAAAAARRRRCRSTRAARGRRASARRRSGGWSR